MELTPADITIAVTVFSRRDYILEAVRSALHQTVPVKVMVVEDCGPDATLRDFVLNEFGDRIEYIRNSQNRGLFGNWNASMEYCRTPWLSILHDDDLLHPHFVETMLTLAKDAPGRALYCGRWAIQQGNGKIFPARAVSWPKTWREIDVVKFADECFIFFPGNLFCVEAVKALGGFRTNSYFTGDWDMWFRLALKFGAAQTAAEVAVNRSHEGVDRGTSVVLRKGWKYALDNVQRKRNLALLRKEKGMVIPFDRAKLLEHNPIPSRWLFRRASGFSERMLVYNWWLFIHSKPPHLSYAALQWLTRCLGPKTLRICSFISTN
ncbi:MAG: glycosyltransferase family 2 protein [Limisphaerales bacterium]